MEEQREHLSTLSPRHTASEWEKVIEDFFEGEEQRTSPDARSEGGGSGMRSMHSEQYTATRTREG